MYTSMPKKRARQVSDSGGTYADSLMAGSVAPWAKGKARKYFRKKYSKAKGGGRGIKGLIRSEIVKMAEKKTVCVNIANGAYVGAYGVVAASMWWQITPNASVPIIAQGTGQGDRIGNRIRITKAVLSLIIRPLEYNATTNAVPVPYDVRMMIVKNKSNPADGTPPAYASLINAGDSSTTPSGNLNDMLTDLNKDVVQLYAQRWCKVGYQGAFGTGTSATNQQFSNNDYKFNYMTKWDVTKYFPAVIEWNDTNSQPTSYGLWFGTLGAAANGATTPANQQEPLALVANITYEFVDA